MTYKDTNSNLNTIGEMLFGEENRSAETFQCQRCLKLYSWKQTLTRHVKYECGKERRVNCPVDCGYRAFHKSDMQKHIVSKHKEFFSHTIN